MHALQTGRLAHPCSFQASSIISHEPNAIPLAGGRSLIRVPFPRAGHTRASWLDTHPPVPEREQSLERRAIALSVEGAAEDCNGVRALLRSLYTRAAGSGTRK
eukprot:scaffold112758_cov29-Tisochrysis_lutea.AAC.3